MIFENCSVFSVFALGLFFLINQAWLHLKSSSILILYNLKELITKYAVVNY